MYFVTIARLFKKMNNCHTKAWLCIIVLQFSVISHNSTHVVLISGIFLFLSCYLDFLLFICHRFWKRMYQFSDDRKRCVKDSCRQFRVKFYLWFVMLKCCLMKFVSQLVCWSLFGHLFSRLSAQLLLFNN